MPCLESIWNFRKSCIFSWCELELDNSLKIIILVGVQIFVQKSESAHFSRKRWMWFRDELGTKVRKIHLVTKSWWHEGSFLIIYSSFNDTSTKCHEMISWSRELRGCPEHPGSRIYLSRTSDSLLKLLVTWNLLAVPLFWAVSLVYISQAVVWPSSLKVAWFQKQ